MREQFRELIIIVRSNNVININKYCQKNNHRKIKKIKKLYLQHSIIGRLRIQHFINYFYMSGVLG